MSEQRETVACPKFTDEHIASITSDVDHDCRHDQIDRVRWSNRAMLMALNTIAELTATVAKLQAECEQRRADFIAKEQRYLDRIAAMKAKAVVVDQLQAECECCRT